MVYQYEYPGGIKVTGLGDFIRGLFFMLQFTERYDLRLHIEMHHPMTQWLAYFHDAHMSDSPKSANYKHKQTQVGYFAKNNYVYVETAQHAIRYQYVDVDDDFWAFLHTLPVSDGHTAMYCINHPNEAGITLEHRAQMRRVLEPTAEMQASVDMAMTNLHLRPRGYRVVHLRLNDDLFYQKDAEGGGSESQHWSLKQRQQLYDIVDAVVKIRRHTSDTLLLIASSNRIKRAVVRQCPNVVTLFHEITHLADPQLHSEAGVRNTLKDFYLMSHAKSIYSFSEYEHGSGFSKWCAAAYAVPYVCIRLRQG